MTEIDEKSRYKDNRIYERGEKRFEPYNLDYKIAAVPPIQIETDPPIRVEEIPPIIPLINNPSQDPLIFIQQTARQLRLDISNREDTRKTKNSEEALGMGYPDFLIYDFPDLINSDGKHFINLYITYGNIMSDGRYNPPSRFKLGFKSYLDHKRSINGVSLKDFDFSRHNASHFGDYQRDVVIGFFYEKMFYNTRKKEPSQTVKISAFKQGKSWIFCRGLWGQDEPFSKRLQGTFKDVEATNPGNDYRPYFHRVMEIAAGYQREQWHDPKIYRGEDRLEKILDSEIDFLFTGEDRTEIKTRIEEARLKMRSGWASVPKLNLGLVTLPNAGQRDIRTDEFVVEAAPYLIEYLHQLGVMASEEAEEIVFRKLTNYFVHDRGFQLNRERAEQIVGNLKNAPKTKEEVA